MNTPIIITGEDHAILSKLIADHTKLPSMRKEVQALADELERAEIVAPEKVPGDVITMNTRAELLDLDTGERMEFTVVVPAEADFDEGKISVFAPIGTGMLGYRVGSEFEWPVPTGVRRLKVTGVHGQPEASLAKAG